MSDAAERIAAEVGAWEGVAVAGETVRFHGRELGRLAAGRVEVRLPPRIAAMLVETGRADPAGPGRVSAPLDEALDLLLLAHERARVARRARGGR